MDDIHLPNQNVSFGVIFRHMAAILDLSAILNFDDSMKYIVRHFRQPLCMCVSDFVWICQLLFALHWSILLKPTIFCKNDGHLGFGSHLEFVEITFFSPESLCIDDFHLCMRFQVDMKDIIWFIAIYSSKIFILACHIRHLLYRLSLRNVDLNWMRLCCTQRSISHEPLGLET